jgi:hypothetical protein
MLEERYKEQKLRVGLTFFSKENFDGSYDLTLKYRGEVVGSCTLSASMRGVADYVLNNFQVKEEYRRGSEDNLKPEEHFGFGSDLIEAVNYFIKSKGFTAYLVNAVGSHLGNFFERHGWVRNTPKSDLILLYNKKPSSLENHLTDIV